MRTKTLVTLVSLLALSLSVFAGDQIDTSKALVGLKKVKVVIPQSDFSDYQKLKLRTQIELKLRTAGLIVEDDAPAKLIAFCAQKDMTDVTIGIQGAHGFAQLVLEEPAKLLRLGQSIVGGESWKGLILIYHGPSLEYISEKASEHFLDSTDAFVNEWLKQNPKDSR